MSEDLPFTADTAVCMGERAGSTFIWKDICLEGMGSVFTPRNLLTSEWLWRTRKICPLSAATTSGKHHQVEACCIPWSAPEPNTCSSSRFFFSLIIIHQDFACEQLHHFTSTIISCPWWSFHKERRTILFSLQIIKDNTAN